MVDNSGCRHAYGTKHSTASPFNNIKLCQKILLVCGLVSRKQIKGIATTNLGHQQTGPLQVFDAAEHKEQILKKKKKHWICKAENPV